MGWKEIIYNGENAEEIRNFILDLDKTVTGVTYYVESNSLVLNLTRNLDWPCQKIGYHLYSGTKLVYNPTAMSDDLEHRFFVI